MDGLLSIGMWGDRLVVHRVVGVPLPSDYMHERRDGRDFSTLSESVRRKEAMSMSSHVHPSYPCVQHGCSKTCIYPSL